MLNGINEKELSKDNGVKIKNFLGGTTETSLEEVEEQVNNNPDTLIVHTGTNDFTKGKNVLNNIKKIIKSVKRFSPQTKLAFSSLIVWKDKKNIDKKYQTQMLGWETFVKKRKLHETSSDSYDQNIENMLTLTVSTDSYKENLKYILKKNLQNIVVTQLNVNSLRN